MIKGIGTDIVEVGRIVGLLKKGEAFTHLVFSEKERRYCEKSGNTSFAGRFAAKEAFLKAIGTGWKGDILLSEIEIENDAFGKPSLNLLGKTGELLSDFAKGSIHVSISHTESYAMAVVIIETE